MSGRICRAHGVFILGDENKLVLAGLYEEPYSYDRAHEEAQALAARGQVAFILEGYRPINQAEPGGNP